MTFLSKISITDLLTGLKVEGVSFCRAATGGLGGQHLASHGGVPLHSQEHRAARPRTPRGQICRECWTMQGYEVEIGRDGE